MVLNTSKQCKEKTLTRAEKKRAMESSQNSQKNGEPSSVNGVLGRDDKHRHVNNRQRDEVTNKSRNGKQDADDSYKSRRQEEDSIKSRRRDEGESKYNSRERRDSAGSTRDRTSSMTEGTESKRTVLRSPRMSPRVSPRVAKGTTPSHYMSQYITHSCFMINDK